MLSWLLPMHPSPYTRYSTPKSRASSPSSLLHLALLLFSFTLLTRIHPRTRIHGIRSLAYFGPWTGASVVGNKAAQGEVYV